MQVREAAKSLIYNFFWSFAITNVASVKQKFKLKWIIPLTWTQCWINTSWITCRLFVLWCWPGNSDKSNETNLIGDNFFFITSTTLIHKIDNSLSSNEREKSTCWTKRFFFYSNLSFLSLKTLPILFKFI